MDGNPCYYFSLIFLIHYGKGGGKPVALKESL